MSVSPEQQVEFLNNLQRLLSEGSFVATYKYALLLAIADAAVEHGDDSGDRLTLKTRQISKHVIAYYWRQTVPYVPRQDPTQGQVLRQNTGRQAAVISKIVEARRKHGDSLPRLMRQNRAWKSLLSKVDVTVRKMPLWKLQTVGSDSLEFLYENTHEGTEITLKPGVAYCLRRFHTLIGDLIRGAWVRYIRRYNKELLGTTNDLTEFLFGSERSGLSTYRPVLMQIQHGRCFYCERIVKEEASHIDHFVPWALYPYDLGHNFVLAHGRCNSAKSDHIAGERFLHQWHERNDDHNRILTGYFDEHELLYDLPTSINVTMWAYEKTFAVDGLAWTGRGKDLAPLSATWRSGGN